jgi:hypothetical protein
MNSAEDLLDQVEPVFYSAIFVLADFSNSIAIPFRQCLSQGLNFDECN